MEERRDTDAAVVKALVSSFSSLAITCSGPGR